ncbi:MAG: bifunctional precorrin-2 dehydrogenase/sirohydrochlorin ferrochelatase [Thermodesulfobacteriota bacterium]
MRYYPVNLDIAGKTCLVVGAGAVAARKAATLASCGARVRVVGPVACGEVLAMQSRGTIAWEKRPYRQEDLDGAFLVIAATDDETVNDQVSRQALARNMLVNVADQPERCSFVLPAVVDRDGLVVTVSTEGKSPAMARRIRQKLETEFGPEYGPFLNLMAAVRARLLARAHAPEEHKELFYRLIDEGLLAAVRDKDPGAADRLLNAVLGPGFSCCELLPGWFS